MACGTSSRSVSTLQDIWSSEQPFRSVAALVLAELLHVVVLAALALAALLHVVLLVVLAPPMVEGCPMPQKCPILVTAQPYGFPISPRVSQSTPSPSKSSNSGGSVRLANNSYLSFLCRAAKLVASWALRFTFPASSSAGVLRKLRPYLLFSH